MNEPCTLGIYEKAMPASLSWEKRLQAAKTAGFDALEISIDETDERLSRLDWISEKCSEVRSASRIIEIPIRTMCLSAHRKFPLGSHDEAIRSRSMDIFKKAAELACDLGIRIIQLAGYDVYYEKSTANSRGWFLENLQSCVCTAAGLGVTLGFETMETPFMDTVAKAMEYVDRINSPYLGIYPDLGNLTNASIIYNHDLHEDIGRGNGHIVAMHLKETAKGRYRDMKFGEGHVDFIGGIKKAREIGVNLFTLECWYNGSSDWEDELKTYNSMFRRMFYL